MSLLLKLKKQHFKLKAHQNSPSVPIDMSRIAAIILGGGEGTRLFPLTATRCKPAIPFGGKYRLIDIPISNSINSKCLKIFIITQFLSTSLHQHINKTYHPGNYNSGFIELLSAQQKPNNKNWFSGTADAVRQNIEYFMDIPLDYFLILSGDQIYHMDYQKIVAFAKNNDADLVISTLPITEKEVAKRMGLLKTNEDFLVVDFFEKPDNETILEDFKIKEDKTYLASMGIYLFKRETLFKLLEKDSGEDFGKHLIPTEIKNGKTFAFIYDGYWEDIGTVSSYYHANMALTDDFPKFNLYDEEQPLFTTHQNLPAAKFFGTKVTQSIISEGSIIEASEVYKSILGNRSVIKDGAVIKNCYISGNDYYHSPVRSTTISKPFEIGKRSIISKAIIDKHVHIGDDVQLINKNKLITYNSDDIYIRDGIIIVTSGASIPNGFTL